MKLTQEEVDLLKVLAGCPDGATEHNVVTVLGFAPRVVYRLIERSLIWPETTTIRPPWNWTIVRLRISDAGRAAL